MKKILLALCFALGIQTSQAQINFSDQTFLPQNAAGFILTNLTTNLFGATGVEYYINAVQFPSIIGAQDQLICYGTNQITNTFPSGVIGGGGFTNTVQVGNAITFYNAALNSLNGTNQLYIGRYALATNSSGGSVGPAPFWDTKLWSDTIGQVSSNEVLELVAQGDNPTTTNTLWWTFGRSSDGTNYSANTADRIAASMAINGTNLCITNIAPAANWMMGYKSCRLISIGESTNAGFVVGATTNTYVQVIKLLGWKP